MGSVSVAVTGTHLKAQFPQDLLPGCDTGCGVVSLGSGTSLVLVRGSQEAVLAGCTWLGVGICMVPAELSTAGRLRST